MAVFGVVFTAPSKAWVPQELHLMTSQSQRKLVATIASIGRSSGGVHGHRSRKGRRRRSPRSESGSESQDEALQSACVSNEGNGNSRVTRKTSSRNKRASKAEEGEGSQGFDSPVEDVIAPVAVTIVSDPELFESVSQEHHQANDDENEQVSSSVAAVDENTSAVQEVEDSSVSEKIVEQVAEIQTQMAEAVHRVVDEVIPEQVTQAAEVLVEQVAALSMVEQVAKVTEQVANLLSSDGEESLESDDEFEAYTTSDLPEFRGIRGLENFTVLQDDHGVMTVIYDLYLYILKKPGLDFVLGMFAAPVAVSMFFTLLYLPQLQGLDFASNVVQYSSSSKFFEHGLELDWEAVFRVLMFSISLSTGLQPELTPLTPYTLVVANINALVAQLLFVFLSGAVFARLSQPSQPIRCSSVALVSPSTAKRNGRSVRVFMTRYVLAGPQPCELVDVKVDLSYKYNTITGAGTYFRAQQSLKLHLPQIRSEVSYLNHGMLVRHIIDESSPLNKRTPEMLKKEDGIFTLSVVGLERSSMQSVFHAQHYSMDDDHVIWDAEFQDMILISKKNMRIVDHSRLSQWRPVKIPDS
ncbi:uncharacterized protein LOC112350126 isoform X2 [Selaginella moellendorffii]|uniref:uncharacterized protein LOC112350126 isoform X2 n=1 Tax=Selaginella moellendorffii TaxID=88036 RepID=UPI000D1C6DE6|nr:uncharacterized protein LOC112350126 isoform X2 [Selaginella moellendorffii]|eukprot:XP_024541558.1 uncharacterized protein LOC112350126 isoform X2 [Selaginella moellendorffii]